MKQNRGIKQVIKSMIGGAGLALAEYRASATGSRLNMSLVNESTKATFFIVLAAPVLSVWIGASIAFISVENINYYAGGNGQVYYNKSVDIYSRLKAFDNECEKYYDEKEAAACRGAFR